MKINCLYCKNETFDQGHGSVEHAIISSIGGKKSSKNICCQACNISLGNEIDKPLAKGLSFLSTLCGITTGRNKDAATLKKCGSHNGKSFDLLPGGQMQFSKANIIREVDKKNKKAKISVSARNMDEAKSILAQQLNSFGKDITDFKNEKFVETIEYPGFITGSLDIGLITQHRSIAKTALTYLATMISPERLRSNSFVNIVNFIVGSEKDTGLVLLTDIEFPAKPDVSSCQHRVIISASQSNKLVIGLIELFGGLKFKVFLTTNWKGPDLQKGYAINPLNGEQIELSTKINLDDSHWKHSKEITDKTEYENILGGVFERAFEVHSRKERERIISEISDNFCKENMGKDLSDELLMELSSKIAKALTNSIFKINETKEIDLNH